MQYRITSSSDYSDTDCIINVLIGSTIPVLTLTDKLKDDIGVITESIDLVAPKNTLYKLDSDGNNVVTHVASATSIGGRENNIYFDTVTKQLFTVMGISDIDDTLFKNREILLKGVMFSTFIPNSPYAHVQGTLTVDTSRSTGPLDAPDTKSIDGKTVDKVSLNLPLMGLSPVDSYMDFGTPPCNRTVSLIDVLTISTKDIGWDSISPLVSTIIRADALRSDTIYVGAVKLDTLYIPLV